MALLPVDEALRRIIEGVEPTEREAVPLAAARGRTLAEPVIATRPQPPFAASAMDGYAVRAADAVAGAELRLIGESTAGRRFAGIVDPGRAVRIFTGAPIPEDTDAILIQENAVLHDGTVLVREPVTSGRFIRPAGLDFSAGDRLLEPGRVLGPRELALAAAANTPTLNVRRRPKVAVLSIGDELVEAGAVPGADEIVGSSAVGVAAIAAAVGAEAVDLGIVRDSADAVATACLRAAHYRVDVLITLGGASVGDYDVARPALAAAGMEPDFWRIAMRPGRPMLFGRLGAVRVLGLPGNPVSSLVCSLLFLRPLIGALLGQPRRDETEPAILGVSVPANDTREDYVRARLEPSMSGWPAVMPLPRQDSSMLRTLADADCLLIRPADAPAAQAGDPCRILRLR